MAKKDLRDRLAKKKKELAERGNKGNIHFLKEGTIRVRVLPVGVENEFVQEVTQFYLGAEIKGVYSPNTFDEPCAIYDKFKELKESSEEGDKELAKSLSPKKKYLMPVIIYKDLKGKEVDEEKGVTMVQITGELYQEIIDLYLDEDEWGDMTDVDNGYDLKLTRTGTGRFDTKYSVSACKNTALKPKFAREVDLDALIKSIIPTYEETQEKLEAFLSGSDSGSGDEDEKPKTTIKKKKRKKKDI